MIPRKPKIRFRTRQRRPPPVSTRRQGSRTGFGPRDLVFEALCGTPMRSLTDEQRRQIVDRFVAPMWDRLIGQLGPRAPAQRLEWATTHVADALRRTCDSYKAVGTAKDLALWAYERGLVR